jgi:hypothetical protein
MGYVQIQALQRISAAVRELACGDQIRAYGLFAYLVWSEIDLISAVIQESMTWDDLEVY